MPGPARIASTHQKRFFDALATCGELILALGTDGVSANLVGTKRARRHGIQDVLDVDDGKCHVHVDWSPAKRAEVGAAQESSPSGCQGSLLRLRC